MCKKFIEGHITLSSENSVPTKNSSSAENPVHEISSTFDLIYYLVESYDDIITNDSVYGIEVVKKCNGKDEEIGTVRNFSSCRTTTEKVVKILYKNSVTPISLYSILDDLLAG